jgi:hypothetical protein
MTDALPEIVPVRTRTDRIAVQAADPAQPSHDVGMVI